MSKTSSLVANEFAETRPTYIALTEGVETLIRRLIIDENIGYLSIHSRVKSIESVESKFDRPEKESKYKSLQEITDLSGVRIVVYTKEDRDRVGSVISNSFSIDDENTKNKDDDLDADRFGYLSHHFIVSHVGARLKLPEYSKFEGLKCEVQVRTVLQHAWADIDWRLRYKTSSEVPKSLRRRLFGISASLEAADNEFSRIIKEAEDIRHEYERAIASGNLSIAVDAESLGAFLESSAAFTRLTEAVKAKGVAVVKPGKGSEERLSILIKAMGLAGLKDLSDLEALISSNAEALPERIKETSDMWSTNNGTRVSFSEEGLIRLSIIYSTSKALAKRLLSETKFATNLQKVIIEMIG